MAAEKEEFPRLLTLRAIGDERGWLTPVEAGKDIPFEVRRVYFIYGTQDAIRRGLHAHRDLEQVAVCVAGSCAFLLDDGHHRREVLLDSPTKGLYIGSMVWREMFNFSSDCVLMVLASRLYDEADYIRDYADFLKLARQEAI
ncbi:MAG TPA: FdtA/QdtA family cupin domain-containing protein [Moraxellaceae bacterium]